ncbi:capsule biosynthesis GfcC D2 domain-containing protein [Sodalis sp.]|uniref:capsule biosynthesis GfcC D2 domain-containing protein n=1 Tax=Sodalis sp. (in: enterobacteria) TaxID=1898979 RepID=UPI003872C9B9
MLARLSVFSTELGGDHDGELATWSGCAQLASIRVTVRKFVPLYPDWIRLHSKANRRLSGD